MKKRMAALVLSLAIFVTLLAPLVPQAQADTVSSYAPKATIHYDYTPITVAGTIRYISQKTESSYFYSKYWGKYVSRASYNCSTSCISMALSYIGIDTTPEDVLDYHIATMFMAPYGGCTPKSYTYDKLSTAVDNYVNGKGKYSPPVIHLDKYSDSGHYVMLIGRISDNKYQVLDPATTKIWTITINGKTATYTYPYGTKTITDNIDNTGTGDVYQWYNADAGLLKDVTVRQGQTAKVSLHASGNNLSYTWYFADAGSSSFSKSTLASGTSYSVEMTPARDGRRVYCKITDKNGYTFTTDTVTLNMAPVLSITKQPESVRVAEGQKATVSVTATGEGLSYEWYFADKGSSSFSKSTNCTGNTYSIEMTDARDGRQLYCVITDKYGDSVKTDTVTISQKARLTIVTQPVSVQVKAGETASATVEAEGDGLKYAWYYTTGGSSTKFYESSNTTPTYSTTMDASRDGRKIYCKVTDAYGNTVKSNTVTLTMKEGDPVTIVTQPVSVTVANGETASATVEAEGDGLKYTWYFTSNAADKTFSKSSTTTATYTTTMDDSRDGRKIYCKITDAYGNTVTSDTVTLKMEQDQTQPTAIAIREQPVNVTVGKGETASTTVVAEGDGLKYTWYYTSNGSDSRFFKSSTTTATYSTTMDDCRDGRKIYCVITDKYGNTVKSNTVTLKMGQDQTQPTALAIREQPVNVTVGKGETASTTVVAEGDGLKYTWYYTSNGSDSRFFKSSTTTATYSTTMDASRDGRKIYCVITDKYGNTVKSNTVTLTMGQQDTGGEEDTVTTLAITRQPVSVTVAAGATASATVEATGEGLKYTWYYTSNGGDSRFFVSSTTTATYSTTMDASRAGRMIYCVITDKYGNTVKSNTVTLGMSQSGTSDSSNANATVTAEDGLNIRNGAGSGYSVVGHYYKGDRIEILEKKTVGSTVWGRTSRGWVSMDYVKMDAGSFPQTRTVTADSLTIRATASTSGKAVGYLYKGDKVEITETKTAGGYTWGKISKGWIALEFTK